MDIELLSAPNRSIWQPLSYSNHVSKIKPALDYNKAANDLESEFAKGDQQFSLLGDAFAKAEALAIDNPIKEGYLNQHKQELNRLTNEVEDPYEIHRGIRKLASRFAKDYSDDNTPLGAVRKSNQLFNENIGEAKNPEQQLLVEDNKRNYENKGGIATGYDPETGSYKNAIYKKREFAPELDPLKITNEGVANYRENAAKSGNTKVTPDGQFLVHSASGWRAIDKNTEAIPFFSQVLKTNKDLQSRLLENAEIKTIKELGKGFRSQSPENEQIFNEKLKNNYNSLSNSWINSSADKLAFKQTESDSEMKANPFALLNAKTKGAQEILNQPLEKPNIGGGVYKNDNIQFTKDLDIKDKTINNKIITDGTTNFKPNEVADIAYNKGLISKEEKLKIENYLWSRTEGPYSSKLNLTEGIRDDKKAQKILQNLGISVQTLTDNKKFELDQKQKQFDYGVINEIYPNILEEVNKLPTDKQQEYLDNFIISKKDEFSKFRKDYLSAIERKGTRNSQASDKARKELSYPENIIPDELNSSIAYADNRGNDAINKNKTPIQFLKDAGVDLEGGDKYKFDLVGTNLTHPTLAGGKEYKVTVNKKNGDQHIFTVVTEPSQQQKLNLQPVRLLNETFSSGYPSKSYFTFSPEGQLLKVNSTQDLERLRNSGKLITLQPEFQKNGNESTVNAKVIFGDGTSTTLEDFTKEYEKVKAVDTEKTLEYNIDARDKKNYQLLNDLFNDGEAEDN